MESRLKLRKQTVCHVLPVIKLSNPCLEKQYTFVLKDYLLPKNPENGREQSTISYEYDFYVDTHSESTSQVIFIPWAGLQATYRGKVKEDAPKLNVRQVKRFSFMMRRYFS